MRLVIFLVLIGIVNLCNSAEEEKIYPWTREEFAEYERKMKQIFGDFEFLSYDDEWKGEMEAFEKVGQKPFEEKFSDATCQVNGNDEQGENTGKCFDEGLKDKEYIIISVGSTTAQAYAVGTQSTHAQVYDLNKQVRNYSQKKFEGMSSEEFGDWYDKLKQLAKDLYPKLNKDVPIIIVNIKADTVKEYFPNIAGKNWEQYKDKKFVFDEKTVPMVKLTNQMYIIPKYKSFSLYNKWAITMMIDMKTPKGGVLGSVGRAFGRKPKVQNVADCGGGGGKSVYFWNPQKNADMPDKVTQLCSEEKKVKTNNFFEESKKIADSDEKVTFMVDKVRWQVTCTEDKEKVDHYYEQKFNKATNELAYTTNQMVNPDGQPITNKNIKVVQTGEMRKEYIEAQKKSSMHYYNYHSHSHSPSEYPNNNNDYNIYNDNQHWYPYAIYMAISFAGIGMCCICGMLCLCIGVVGGAFFALQYNKVKEQVPDQVGVYMDQYA